MPAASLFDAHRDALNLELQYACRHMHFHHLARPFAQERLGNGGFDAEFACSEVGLMRIHDGIYHLGTGGLVGHLHLAEESHCVTFQL